MRHNHPDIKLSDCMKDWGKTRIVCTIGPATADPIVIKALIEAGMSVARINHSHGDEKIHRRHIQTVRSVAEQCGVGVGVLVDLAGPKYRTAGVGERGIHLKRGETFVISADESEFGDKCFGAWPAGFHKDAKAGSLALFDDAVLEATVKKVEGKRVTLEATIDGAIMSNKTISIPDSDISLDYMTEKTKAGLEFALDADAEFIGLSCIRNRDDIETVRRFIKARGDKAPRLVSKIEMAQVMRGLEDVIDASDIVMVARGDLGIEINLADLPMAQNRIIELCNIRGKQVITATQMLESMINSARPTRAEVTDISAAVQQGSDALMLSAETAIGRYPVRAMRYMSAVARNAENNANYAKQIQARLDYLNRPKASEVRVDDIIAYGAAQISHEINAKLIIAFTETGSSARRVASFKPQVPIIAAIRSKSDAVNDLMITWGVKSVAVGEQSSFQDMFYLASQLALVNGYADAGDLIVVVMGMPIGIGGNTNLVRVVRVPEPAPARAK